MRAGQVLDRRGDLAIAVFIALALMLVIAGGATGLQWLSARWSTTCHRLLHAPSPPRFTQPWRVVDAPPETLCAPRLP